MAVFYKTFRSTDYISNNPLALKFRNEFAQNSFNSIKNGVSAINDVAMPLWKLAKLPGASKLTSKVTGGIGSAISIVYDVYDTFLDGSFIETGERSLAAHRIAYNLWNVSTDLEGEEQIRAELLAHLFVNYGYEQLYNAFYWVPGINKGDSKLSIALKVTADLGGAALTGAVTGVPGVSAATVGAKLINIYSNVLGILNQGWSGISIDPYLSVYSAHNGFYNHLRKKILDTGSESSVVAPQLKLAELPVLKKEITDYVIYHISSQDLLRHIEFKDVSVNKADYAGLQLDEPDFRNTSTVGASILIRKSNSNAHIDIIIGRDTTDMQIEAPYFTTDYKVRNTDGVHRRRRHPLSDIILYVKKTGHRSADSVETTPFNELRLQLSLSNASGTGWIDHEILLSELDVSSRTEKSLTPALLDLNSVFSTNIDEPSGIPVTGIFMSNALPDRQSENHIRVLQDTLPWSIIRINPNAPEVAEIYFGKDGDNYKEYRINLLTGKDNNGDVVLTHRFLENVANETLAAPVLAVFDSYIANFSGFIDAIKADIQRRIKKVKPSLSSGDIAYATAEILDTSDDEISVALVAININHPEWGDVSGQGGNPVGDKVTLTAYPKEGYQFVNWVVDGNEVEKSLTYSFTVQENTII